MPMIKYIYLKYRVLNQAVLLYHRRKMKTTDPTSTTFLWVLIYTDSMFTGNLLREEPTSTLHLTHTSTVLPREPQQPPSLLTTGQWQVVGTGIGDSSSFPTMPGT